MTSLTRRAWIAQTASMAGSAGIAIGLTNSKSYCALTGDDKTKDAIQKGKAYIQSLTFDKERTADLPNGVGIRDVQFADKTKAAFVNDGSLVCFNNDAPVLAVADVSNSILLSQRAASKKHDRLDKTSDWNSV